MIPDNKKRLTITLEKNVIENLEYISEVLSLTKSEVLDGLIKENYQYIKDMEKESLKE